MRYFFSLLKFFSRSHLHHFSPLIPRTPLISPTSQVISSQSQLVHQLSKKKKREPQVKVTVQTWHRTWPRILSVPVRGTAASSQGPQQPESTLEAWPLPLAVKQQCQGLATTATQGHSSKTGNSVLSKSSLRGQSHSWPTTGQTTGSSLNRGW